MADSDVIAYDKRLEVESKIERDKQTIYDNTIERCRQAMQDLVDVFEEECRKTEIDEVNSEELWKELLNDGFDGMRGMKEEYKLKPAKTMKDWNAEDKWVRKGEKARGFTPEGIALFEEDQVQPRGFPKGVGLGGLRFFW